MAAISTSSRSTWAARPTVGRLASPPGSRLVAHDLARKAAVRGAAWATPTVRGSVRIERADRIGLAMRSTLTRGQASAVDRDVARQLAPPVAGDLGQGEELPTLAGAEGLAVATEDESDTAGREHGKGHVVWTGVTAGCSRRRRAAVEKGGQ